MHQTHTNIDGDRVKTGGLRGVVVFDFLWYLNFKIFSDAILTGQYLKLKKNMHRYPNFGILQVLAESPCIR